MNFKYAKTLFMGSVFSMAAFGLMACGDDSSSGPEQQAPSSSASFVPSNDVDAGIISKNTSSRVNAYNEAVFTGTFSLDYADTTNLTDEQRNNLKFTGIQLGVFIGTQEYKANIKADIPANIEMYDRIDLGAGALGVTIDLNDPALTKCGPDVQYTLGVKVTGTDGKNTLNGSASIPFDAPACKTNPTEESSSSQAEIPMVPCQVVVNTSTAPGVDLATCFAVPAPAATADMFFTVEGGTAKEPELKVTSNSGVVFTPITNDADSDISDDWGVGFWPEEQAGRTSAYVSDFKYRIATGKSIDNFIENALLIYIAKTPSANKETGDGVYPFAMTDRSRDANNNYTITLKIYHK